jgi:hypothetical protein
LVLLGGDAVKSLLRLVASGTVLALAASCGTTGNHAGKQEPPTRQAERGGKTPEELARSISSIAPWSSAAPYSGSDWEHILDVAKELNEADANDVRRAFEVFAAGAAQRDRPTFLEVSKAFILLRVMFKFPNKEVPHIGGWIAPQDTVAWGWPVVWRNGRPKLLSPFLGYEGIPYEPTVEYDEVAREFSRRHPKALQKARLSLTVPVSDNVRSSSLPHPVTH